MRTNRNGKARRPPPVLNGISRFPQRTYTYSYTASGVLVKPYLGLPRLQRSREAPPPGAAAGRGGRGTAVCERSRRLGGSGPSGLGLGFGPAGSSWPPAPPCSRPRWSVSLRSILPNLFGFSMLPVSLTRLTGPKHYVVALGEPNLFCALSPARSLTPLPVRNLATGRVFATSASLLCPPCPA